MLQAYSTNVAVAANATCPFNNVTIEKGSTAKLTAPGTIELNNRGVYLVEFDASVTPAAAGLVSFQLTSDGAALPQAIAQFTGAVDTVGAASFKTFVQVARNNTCCCCSSPVVLRVMNGATALEDAHFNICVSKIC